MISIYKKSEAIPLIIDLLEKEGFSITADNIKIWQQETMRLGQVKEACDWIKSKKGLVPILVYASKVPLKSYLQEHEGIKIFDEEDLAILSIRHNSPLIKYL